MDETSQWGHCGGQVRDLGPQQRKLVHPAGPVRDTPTKNEITCIDEPDGDKCRRTAKQSRGVGAQGDDIRIDNLKYGRTNTVIGECAPCKH